MGLIDKLLGRDEAGPERGEPRASRDPDDVAVERYRYLLRTAPPDALEEAHAEAFAALTPEQRRRVLAALGEQVPEPERADADDPRSLARMATRAELRRPGTLERTFGGGGGMGGGTGMGGLFAGTLLASIAGSFIGSAIGGALMNDAYADGYRDGGEQDAAASEGDQDAGGEGDLEATGSEGDFDGSEFGGGDLGGGDFGGGDMGF